MIRKVRENLKVFQAMARVGTRDNLDNLNQLSGTIFSCVIGSKVIAHLWKKNSQVHGPGNSVQLPNHPSALDFFSLFVTEDDFEVMANEINRYARQYLDEKAATIKLTCIPLIFNYLSGTYILPGIYVTSVVVLRQLKF